MSTTQVKAKAAPHEFVPSLLALLRDMVKERRTSYRDSDLLITRNLENGVRRRGKAKLKLSKDELVKHMEAVETRRHMQRQLQVLVPLMHRVVSCVQMKPKTVEAFDTALSPFRVKLAGYACSSGKQGKYEKPVAGLLISAFPDLLQSTVDSRPTPQADKPKVDEKRLELYNKITSAGLLDGKEIENLRVIFWG